MHYSVCCGFLSSLVFMSELPRVCLVLNIVQMLYRFPMRLNFSETLHIWDIHRSQRLFFFIRTIGTLGINNWVNETL
jgi:hypothetical protein